MREGSIILMLLLVHSLHAHHFTPQFIAVAHTRLSLAARGERWEPG